MKDFTWKRGEKMAGQIRQFQGTVLEQGYGIVAKLVMKDRNIHGMAKALYAYLCTYGNTAFPSRELICKDLGITKDTYTKYLNQILEAGYITIEKGKNGSKFANNIYHINQVKTPCPKFSDTKTSDTVFYDTNNTSENKISLKNTTINKAAVVVSSAVPEEADAERELIARAEALGVQRATTTKYIRQRGIEAVKKQVVNLENAIEEGKKPGNKPVVIPGAWLYTALTEGFVDTKAEYQKEQAVQKAQAQETSRRIEEEAQARLLTEIEEPLDPNSPFAQIVARIGVLKAM